MKTKITIPRGHFEKLKRHFFQNELEQGAFLFARFEITAEEVLLTVEDMYLVPRHGWEVQHELYLQMRDSERAKIMKIARDKKLAAIDCHSHPQSGEDVWFSTSDIAGIAEYSQYAFWKLDGKPFAALVFGEASCDAVIWCGTFEQARRVAEIQILGNPDEILKPRNSWFNRNVLENRSKSYE